MQQIPFIDLFIDLFKSALHVSDDKLTHLQEHVLTVYAVFGTMHRYYCRSVTGRQQCRCIASQRNLLHLAGWLRRCSNDARSHKSQQSSPLEIRW
jgi:hypothetical protein